MTPRLIRADAGGVCTLTFNRPEKLNALDGVFFDSLETELLALQDDESVGCVVLRGAGRGFCAGADLNDIGSGEGRPAGFKGEVIERLARLPKPVVAAVHGVCFTGGLELALACDFILAEEGARFADTHAKWGLVASWGMSQRLPRRIGTPAAKRMMMTCRVFEAAEALQLGLVDLLAPAGGLEALVEGFAGELTANSWFTNAANKQLLLDTDGMGLAEGLAHEVEHHPGRAPDSRERIDRFRRG